MKNITYFLGAGASYNSNPIQKELSNKMMQLANKYLPEEKKDFTTSKPPDLSSQENILWDIGYFGNKAIQYGSIDTYAKKLIFSGSPQELERLKLAVSIFFTLWQFTDDIELKDPERYSDIEIDRRFIQLLASVLNKTNDHFPSLQDNIRFVTWNYDLQIEFAYKAFCPEGATWKDVVQNLRSQTFDNKAGEIQICHLNGYHGFYSTPSGEKNILDLIDSKDVNTNLNKISYLYNSQNHGTADITRHIHFAWEADPSNTADALEQAKRIFSKTDILVIIGYSFPYFNKDIDKQLFDKLIGRRTIIHYQDPKASEEIISHFVYLGTKETKLEIRPISEDGFFRPYEI
jgi:hypothetical protein